MYIAEIRITGGQESPEALGLVQTLIAAWANNGQAVPWWIEVWGDKGRSARREGDIHFDDESFRCRVRLSAPNSLFTEHDSPAVIVAKSELARRGFKVVQVERISEKYGRGNPCCCDASTFYVLSASDESLNWSLRCGSCSGLVPRYLLIRQIPHSPEFDHLCSTWQADYSRLNQICEDGGPGCRAAKRELSNLDSSLTRHGREICQVIAAGSGKPVYYYLYRDGGRSRQSEMRSRCPSCRGDWLILEPMVDSYDFKCDQCRLISNMGVLG